MKKPKILVVGSFVMDLIVRSQRFVKAGETILGHDFQTASGGKGANQAVQAARLGADVTMVGKVGRDAFGAEMLASLKASGVNVDKVIVTDEAASGIGNIQIQTGEGGTQNRIVVVPGANMTIRPDEVVFLKDEIAEYDMVILQLEIPMEINELVAGYAFAKEVPVMLNPAPSSRLPDELLAHTTWLSPNEYEAADLCGFAIINEATLEAAVEALCQKGAKNVLITLGGEGAALGRRGTIRHSPCVRCKQVADPTAAGDSFIGAFCTALCAGMPEQDAMSFAHQAASITVSRMGAQPSLPTLDMINEALAQSGKPTLRYS